MIGINAIPFYNLVQNQQIIFIEINSLFEIIHNLGHELSEPQENKKDFLKIKKESKEKIKIKVEKINILINKFNQNLESNHSLNLSFSSKWYLKIHSIFACISVLLSIDSISR